MVYPFYNEKSGAPNDVAPHLKTINEVMVKKKKSGCSEKGQLRLFYYERLKNFYLLPTIHKRL